MTVDSRVLVLREIAGRYHELVSPSSANGAAGSGDHVPLTPSTYTATVKEFERQMAAMKYDRATSLVRVGPGKVSVRKLRWHIMEWYCEAQPVQRQAMLHRGKDGGWQPLLDRAGWPVDRVPFGTPVLREGNGAPTRKPVLCYLRLNDAREHLADAGLEWIADHWPQSMAEPMEPDASTDKKPQAVIQLDGLEMVNRRTRQAMRDARAAAA